jgi:hypothetical protein
MNSWWEISRNFVSLNFVSTLLAADGKGVNVSEFLCSQKSKFFDSYCFHNEEFVQYV